MKIIIDYPPNYVELKKAFGLRRNSGVVFTWGDTLYNPDDVPVSDHLLAHEYTHTRQQEIMTPEKWWERYLGDPKFRLSQEVEAYQVQYRCLQQNHNRAYRREVLPQICKHLSSYIYGKLVTKQQAKTLIVRGA